MKHRITFETEWNAVVRSRGSQAVGCAAWLTKQEALLRVEAAGAELAQAHPVGLSGRQKGSAAATNSTGTSLMNPFSHSAQYFMPACSDTTCPSTINAFFWPDVIASCEG